MEECCTHRDKEDKSHLSGDINLGLKAKALVGPVTSHHRSLVPFWKVTEAPLLTWKKPESSVACTRLWGGNRPLIQKPSRTWDGGRSEP